MPPARQSQHRQRREVQEIRQSEVQEFRAENQRLRREVARLNRELQRRSSHVIEEDEEPAIMIPTQPSIPKEGGCLDCGGDNLTTVKIGPKTLTVCKDCKWRKAG